MKTIVLAVVIGLAGMSAQAATTTYSDFDSWTDNLTGIVTLDTFNGYDFSNGDGYRFFGPSTTLGGVTYSIGSGALYGVSNLLNYDAPYHTSNYLEWQGGTPNTLTITLAGNTNAFSIKIGQFYGAGDTYNIQLGNGDSFTVNGGSAYSFFGAISTTAFSTIQITGNAAFPTIDNLGLGLVAAVPEPETYAMLLAGLGLMGGIARRRKQQQASA